MFQHMWFHTPRGEIKQKQFLQTCSEPTKHDLRKFRLKMRVCLLGISFFTFSEEKNDLDLSTFAPRPFE